MGVEAVDLDISKQKLLVLPPELLDELNLLMEMYWAEHQVWLMLSVGMYLKKPVG